MPKRVYKSMKCNQCDNADVDQKMNKRKRRCAANMRAEAARTGCANRTWTNKNSGLEHAALISFSGIKMVCTSLKATTLDMLMTGAYASGISKNAPQFMCRGRQNLAGKFRTHEESKFLPASALPGYQRLCDQLFLPAAV